jgi:hypothetical protein
MTETPPTICIILTVTGSKEKEHESFLQGGNQALEEVMSDPAWSHGHS